MSRTAIFPADRQALYDRNGYSAAVRSGDLLFISGQVGVLADGTPVPDVPAQIDQAFANLDAVLKAAGCSFDDIVDVTVFHVGTTEHFPAFMQVKAKWFARPPFPALTAIGVNFLYDVALVLEIKAIARVPGPTS